MNDFDCCFQHFITSVLSAVCTAGALPVFTPVTTPSIVLLPEKKERKPS